MRLRDALDACSGNMPSAGMVASCGCVGFVSQRGETYILTAIHHDGRAHLLRADHLATLEEALCHEDGWQPIHVNVTVYDPLPPFMKGLLHGHSKPNLN